MQYGGDDVLAITYKSTRQWLEKNCFVPSWLKLSLHHGASTGTNEFEDVAAQFSIGRLLPSAETIARMVEALFGEYVADRVFVPTPARINTVAGADGSNAVEVLQWRSRHPLVERMRRQVTERNAIQEDGRGRPGLANAERPLASHLWMDVPLPVGPVIAQEWTQIEARGEALQLAAGGVWTESGTDAEQIYGKDIASAEAIRKERERHGGSLWDDIEGVSLTVVRRAIYQRGGAGHSPTRAMFMREIADPQRWLEDKFGEPLLSFVSWSKK
jgi:hypothetical protein